MTQHFTRSTVSSAFYCSKCGKVTQHRIDDRRKGPCLDCIDRLNRQHAEAEQEARRVASRQGDLFRHV
jgi:ribosomal protein L44E